MRTKILKINHLKQLGALLEVILPLLGLTTLAQLLQNPSKPVELLPEVEKITKSVRFQRRAKMKLLKESAKQVQHLSK